MESGFGDKIIPVSQVLVTEMFSMKKGIWKFWQIPMEEKKKHESSWYKDWYLKHETFRVQFGKKISSCNSITILSIIMANE